MALFKRNPDAQTSIWHDSFQLSQLLGFAPTELGESTPPALFDPARAFDVCHVGIVMRAVLGVQALLALGVLLVAPDFAGWVSQVGTGTVVTMFGVLSWLLAVCAAKRVLPRLPEAGQWALLMGLGAVCALFGWQVLAMALGDPGNFVRQLGVALVGASLAAVMLAWLKLRERSQRPADAIAQLVELQSRIRPHFLFNTLNSAIALVRVDPARAESVLEDLAELFRVALAGSSASVTLEEEIELAKRYLAIEQIRFGSRLRVVWRLDPMARKAQVPPLIMQPLVENAVRHGVEPNDDGGELEVMTNQTGSEVEIRLVNTVGLPARVQGHGMALRNVRQRLRLMHDVAARFEVEQTPGKFSLRIVVPLK